MCYIELNENTVRTYEMSGISIKLACTHHTVVQLDYQAMEWRKQHFLTSLMVNSSATLHFSVVGRWSTVLLASGRSERDTIRGVQIRAGAVRIYIFRTQRDIIRQFDWSVT